LLSGLSRCAFTGSQTAQFPAVLVPQELSLRQNTPLPMGPQMWISFKEPVMEPELKMWRSVVRLWDKQ